ncbi:MAG: TraR/DksA C4-type zinc finger protein [Nocardioides sp.]
MPRASAPKEGVQLPAVQPRSLAVKPGEKPWTKAELTEVITELHQHRDRLAHLLHDQEQELADLMRDAGDGAGQDQADLGATSFERDQELTVLNNEREMLFQIERALSHIDDGTYGVCENCGEAIGKMRMMAFPRATLCLSCKQREERR